MLGWLDPTLWPLVRRPSPLEEGQGPDLRKHALTDAQAYTLNTTDALVAWLDAELARLHAKKGAAH